MVYFGAGDLLFFVRPNKGISFTEQDYIVRSVPHQILMHAEFAFIKDPDTDFFKFVKFRADNKPSGRFYQSFDHVLDEIARGLGSDIMALRRMKEFRNYGSDHTHKIIFELRKEYMK